jgi:hypothetical protein
MLSRSGSEAHSRPPPSPQLSACGSESTAPLNRSDPANSHPPHTRYKDSSVAEWFHCEEADAVDPSQVRRPWRRFDATRT